MKKEFLSIFIQDNKPYVKLPNGLKLLLIHKKFYSAIIEYLKNLGSEFTLLFGATTSFLDEIDCLQDAWKEVEKELDERGTHMTKEERIIWRRREHKE